jgi:hypothetical protein
MARSAAALRTISGPASQNRSRCRAIDEPLKRSASTPCTDQKIQRQLFGPPTQTVERVTSGVDVGAPST